MVKTRQTVLNPSERAAKWHILETNNPTLVHVVLRGIQRDTTCTKLSNQLYQPRQLFCKRKHSKHPHMQTDKMHILTVITGGLSRVKQLDFSLHCVSMAGGNRMEMRICYKCWKCLSILWILKESVHRRISQHIKTKLLAWKDTNGKLCFVIWVNWLINSLTKHIVLQEELVESTPVGFGGKGADDFFSCTKKTIFLN